LLRPRPRFLRRCAPQGFTVVNILACSGKSMLLADILGASLRITGPSANQLRS
jgi:hypothetical protein